MILLVIALTALAFPLLAQNSDTKVMNLAVTIQPSIVLEVLSATATEKITFNQQDIQKGASSKSIQVRVNSNKNAPYKVFMLPIGSFANERGLDLSSEFITFNIAGVQKGKNEIPEAVPLPTNEQLIYTSNSEGDAETFTIMFYLETLNKIIPAGKYNLNFKFRLATQ
jgi:hypothetical protein